MKLFTPITFPCLFTKGPPEFPGFSGVSIWMYAGISFGPCLFSAEIIPSVTLNESPSGFPIAIVFSPTFASSEFPKLRYS